MPTKDRAQSEATIEHPRWHDVTDETGFDFHWHHDEYDPYLSIRLADESSGIGLGGFRSGWTIELYPDPENDGRCSRWRAESESEAIEKVQEIMEEYADVP